MRRQSLRPRQIDVHARMRIIRSEEDLVVDDDNAGGGGGANAVGAQPTAATFEELISVRFCLVLFTLGLCMRESNIPRFCH